MLIRSRCDATCTHVSTILSFGSHSDAAIGAFDVTNDTSGRSINPGDCISLTSTIVALESIVAPLKRFVSRRYTFEFFAYFSSRTLERTTPFSDEIGVISRADTELTREQINSSVANIKRLGKYIEKMSRNSVYKKSGENEFLHQIFTQMLFFHQSFCSDQAPNSGRYTTNYSTDWSKQCTDRYGRSNSCSYTKCSCNSESFHNSATTASTTMRFCFFMWI